MSYRTSKNNFKNMTSPQLPIASCQLPVANWSSITNWLLLIASCLLLISIASCKSKQKETASKDPDIYYTCSMHPNIMQEKPGNCPVCGMKLIEAKKSETQKPDEIQLSDGQMQLGN